MSKSYWIWYPGDFELYHGMKQNFSRVERGLDGRLSGRVKASATVLLFAALIIWRKKHLSLYIPMRSDMCWQEKRNIHLEKRSQQVREK